MTTTTLAASDRWLSTAQGAAVGIAGLVGHVIALQLVSHDVGIRLVALEIALIYAVYLGFVVMQGGVHEFYIESLFIGVGLATAGLGLAYGAVWLALGLALHGIWDLLHHRDHHVVGVRGVPPWYISMCAAYDIPVALTVLVQLG